jgi:hypothetical protein
LERRKKEKRKHITLLENMQKMSQERKKTTAVKSGSSGSFIGCGKDSIKDGLAKLMKAGQAAKQPV